MVIEGIIFQAYNFIAKMLHTEKLLWQGIITSGLTFVGTERNEILNSNETHPWV